MSDGFVREERQEQITRNLVRRIKASYNKTDYINSSVGGGDAGKPIVLDASGLIDTSLLPSEVGFGSVAWYTDEYAGTTIPNTKLMSFAVETTVSGTSANDYIEVARIELAGSYSGGWVRINGLSGSDNRENHPVEIDIQGSIDGLGAAVAPVITQRGRLSGYNFFVYLEVDGGGSGIHYYHIYYKATSNWNSLNGMITGKVSSNANCEITVWQLGNNTGESIPIGTLYQATSWWGVMDEFRVYDADLSDYGRIYAEDAGFFIKSVNDPLYLNHSTVQPIYVFANILSGNPVLRWFGWDSGTSSVKYGDVSVHADGSTWVQGEEYLRLVALGNYVDILPNNASYGLVLRKHDANGASGTPYANFFVEDASDASPDYLNIVLGQVGATLGLVVSADQNIGVGKVPSASFDVDVNGYMNAARYYVGANNYHVVSGDYNRFQTQHGYIQLGPANTSYAHIYTDIDGGFYFNKNISAERFASRIITGTSPLTVVSTTKVTNLNADWLDGYASSAFPQLVYKSSPGAFNVTTGGVWYDADLTSLTSANATWAYLHLHVYTTADTHEARIVVCPYNQDLVWAECRVYGGSRIAYDAHGAGNSGSTFNDMCVWVPLASGQLMSYYATKSGSGFIGSSTAHFDVIAYIEEK